MIDHCPHCGLSPVLARPQIDYATSELVFEGRRCALSGVERDIIELILESYPRAVARDLITGEFLEHARSGSRLLNVYVCRIRKRMRAAGMQLDLSRVRHWGERSFIGLIPTSQPPQTKRNSHAPVRRRFMA